jgi:hypothetical protein
MNMDVNRVTYTGTGVSCRPGNVVAKALVKNKHQDVDDNENVVDIGGQVPVAVVVSDGDHAMGFSRTCKARSRMGTKKSGY